MESRPLREEWAEIARDTDYADQSYGADFSVDGRLATYVDARTAKVIRTEQEIQTVDGQGHSLYSGTVPLETTLSGSAYRLNDATRGNTYTGDAANMSIVAQPGGV